MKKSRKWSLIGGSAVVLAVAAWGFSTLNGASSTIDPSKIATVERGTITQSVVATGKIEPITKVEIKSKANGIIEKLFVDVDHLVTAGQVLAELDKENLNARVHERARLPGSGPDARCAGDGAGEGGARQAAALQSGGRTGRAHLRLGRNAGDHRRDLQPAPVPLGAAGRCDEERGHSS